jgi:serine/threonine-protein kinase RsbW
MSAERLERRAEAHPLTVGELRAELLAYANRAGACPECCEAVALAASEAITNVVVHAYVDRSEPGAVIVEAWADDDGQLMVKVCDEGVGMVPRTDSPGLGMGLALIAQMADDFRVADRPQEPGAIVSMRFSLDGSGAHLAEDIAA